MRCKYLNAQLQLPLFQFISVLYDCDPDTHTFITSRVNDQLLQAKNNYQMTSKKQRRQIKIVPKIPLLVPIYKIEYVSQTLFLRSLEGDALRSLEEDKLGSALFWATNFEGWATWMAWLGA